MKKNWKNENGTEHQKKKMAGRAEGEATKTRTEKQQKRQRRNTSNLVCLPTVIPLRERQISIH